MSVQSRFAGKALYDFLKTASSAISGSVSSGVTTKLKSLEDATGIFGFAAKHPEMIGKLTGAVAGPLTIAGGAAGVAAGSAALGNMFNPAGGVYSRSDYSLPVRQQATMGRTPSFSGQRYVPGSSPLTNEQMGESLLEQQKFQHQLQLIQARNASQNYDGSLGSGVLSGRSGTGDIMNQMQQILNTSPVYK